MQIPELTPIEPVAPKEFIVRWQDAIDSVGISPLHAVAFMAIAESSERMPVPRLGPRITELQGDAPAIHFHANHSTVRTLAQRLVALRMCNSELVKGVTQLGVTGAGRRSIPLIGVFALWQLKHGTTLEPILGPLAEIASTKKPYSNAATRRFRILQQVLIDDKVNFEQMCTIMPMVKKTSVHYTLGSMWDMGLFDHSPPKL